MIKWKPLESSSSDVHLKDPVFAQMAGKDLWPACLLNQKKEMLL